MTRAGAALMHIVRETPGKRMELDKRQYMPGNELHFGCPKCGVGNVINFGTSYLSYPIANEFEPVTGYCQECNHEWPLGDVRVNITLTARDAEGNEIAITKPDAEVSPW